MKKKSQQKNEERKKEKFSKLFFYTIKINNISSLYFY